MGVAFQPKLEHFARLSLLNDVITEEESGTNLDTKVACTESAVDCGETVQTVSSEEVDDSFSQPIQVKQFIFFINTYVRNLILQDWVNIF